MFRIRKLEIKIASEISNPSFCARRVVAILPDVLLDMFPHQLGSYYLYIYPNPSTTLAFILYHFSGQPVMV